MKKINSLLLATFLGAVLIFGQSSAVVAATQSPSAPAALEAQLFDGTDPGYSVSFDNFGPDVLTNLEQDADGTYHFVTSSQTPQLRVSANFTGFTVWETFIGNSTINTTAYMPYTGQVFLINNGEISIMATPDKTIPMTSDTNIISILYVSKDQSGDTVWAAETRVVRVAASENDFGPFTARDVPVDFSGITDLAESTTTVDATNVVTRENTVLFGVLDNRNTLLEPEQDLSATYAAEYPNIDDPVSTVTTSGNTMDLNLNDTYMGTMEVSGEVNTTGFWAAQQTAGVVDSTVGFHLVQDASGLRAIEDVSTISLYAGPDYTDVVSGFAIISIADYGWWDYDQDELFSAFGGVDWDSTFSTSSVNAFEQNYTALVEANLLPADTYLGASTNLTELWEVYDAGLTFWNPVSRFGYNATTHETNTTNGSGAVMYGTFDFLADSFQVNVLGQSQYRAIVDVVSSEENSTITSTVTVTTGTTVNTVTTGVTSTAVDQVNTTRTNTANVTTSAESPAPGFGLAVSMAATAFVAYAIPRIRRKE